MYPVLVRDIYDWFGAACGAHTPVISGGWPIRVQQSLASHNNMARSCVSSRGLQPPKLSSSGWPRSRSHSPLIAFLFEIFHLVHFQSKRRRSLTHTRVLTRVRTCAIAEDGIPACQARAPSARIVYWPKDNKCHAANTYTNPLGLASIALSFR